MKAWLVLLLALLATTRTAFSGVFPIGLPDVTVHFAKKSQNHVSSWSVKPRPAKTKEGVRPPARVAVR